MDVRSELDSTQGSLVTNPRDSGYESSLSVCGEHSGASILKLLDISQRNSMDTCVKI